jgi:hypothetical protein
MDTKDIINTRYIINDGYKIINDNNFNNDILENVVKEKDVNLQKNIVKNYMKDLDNLDECALINLSEAILYVLDRSTLQKSMMIGALRDENKVIRTKNGIKITNVKGRFVNIPYSKIKDEATGKEIAKIIRKESV